MTDTRRTAYNKLKYDAIRQQREAINAFKAANPERFAELLKRVEEDTPVSTPLSNTHLFTPKPRNSFNWVDKLIAEVANGRKDYYIYVEIQHIGWTEKHKYFEMLYEATSSEAAAKINERWNTTYLPENIKRVEKCSCPACV
jgi:hypothetical protein